MPAPAGGGRVLLALPPEHCGLVVVQEVAPQAGGRVRATWPGHGASYAGVAELLASGTLNCYERHWLLRNLGEG